MPSADSQVGVVTSAEEDAAAAVFAVELFEGTLTEVAKRAMPQGVYGVVVDAGWPGYEQAAALMS